MMRSDRIKATVAALKNLTDIPHPSLGIDLDGCVDECPIFFNVLTNFWPGKVFVLTFRDDRKQAEADLTKYGINYDQLILVDSFDGKAEAILREGILVYFDDQPEMLKNIPPLVNVMLVRNDGNFCFTDRLWMLSDKTGRLA